MASISIFNDFFLFVGHLNDQLVSEQPVGQQTNQLVNGQTSCPTDQRVGQLNDQHTDFFTCKPILHV